MADVLAYRLAHPSVRSVAAVSTLVVSLFYMIAQMVGAGSLVNLLIPEISFNTAIVSVGVLMIVYVVFGGMLATTWVQIVKAVLLMAGTIVLSIMVMSRFDFSFVKFFDAVASVTGTVRDAGGNVIATKNFTQPGLRYNGTVRTAGSHLARDGLDFRNRRAAAHPDALLHRADGSSGSGLRGLGHGPDRMFLHHDDVPRIWRGDSRGKSQYRSKDVG